MSPKYQPQGLSTKEEWRKQVAVSALGPQFYAVWKKVEGQNVKLSSDCMSNALFVFEPSKITSSP